MENDLPAVMSRGACADLPTVVFDKYFVDVQGHRAADRFKIKTARAICARCPIRAECLETAVTRPAAPDRMIVAGLVWSQVDSLRAWRAYDTGARATMPRKPRPVLLETPAESPAAERAAEVRRVAELSFGERVYLVFRDVKAGKYAKLNDAVTEIARLHEEYK